MRTMAAVILSVSGALSACVAPPPPPPPMPASGAFDVPSESRCVRAFGTVSEDGRTVAIEVRNQCAQILDCVASLATDLSNGESRGSFLAIGVQERGISRASMRSAPAYVTRIAAALRCQPS